MGGHTGEGEELALGHLVDMTKPSDVGAELWLHALPVLPGAEACVAELKAKGYAHTAVIGRVMVQVDAVEHVGLVGCPGGCPCCFEAWPNGVLFVEI